VLFSCATSEKWCIAARSLAVRFSRHVAMKKLVCAPAEGCGKLPVRVTKLFQLHFQITTFISTASLREGGEAFEDK
jgi:hypothetical protein